MVRNVLGSLIALIGATAAVWSPFRPWYDGRHGSDVRIEDLFNGITGSSATLFGSLVLPMVFAGLLTLVGVVLRSRLLITLAGLVVLGFTVLWMVRQGQRTGELAAGAHALGVGAANALGGGALLILGALVMRGRPRRVPAHEDDDGHGGYDAYGAYDHDGRDGYDSHGHAHRPPPDAWDPGGQPTRTWHPQPPGPAPGPPTPPHGPQAPTPPVEWGRNRRPAPEHDTDDRPTRPTRPDWPAPPNGPEAPHDPGASGPDAPR
ncbi:hypothetical protein [Streptomyces lunalinharesii]|uniref:Integral membrane protein n=1 Tax=Streptomyces lunalinharesii TaxID=333384 RepID=A0ABN3SP53_9ACTN